MPVSASSSSNSSSSSSSDSESGNGNSKINTGQRQKGSSQLQSTLTTSDDLVSVSVRKSDQTQKAGVSLVERQQSVYVTKVIEHGLFHETEIEVGDIVLSINGQRLKKGEGAREIMKQISNAKTMVTMVVKKANRKASKGVRSLSPNSQRRRKYKTKLYKKAMHRNEDGSFNYALNPHIENIKKHDPNDDKPQIPIQADKIFSKQDVGVRFKDINNMIFVSAIAIDSIFRDTHLELGDRVVGVNGMNFMSYGDSKYAMKLVAKAPKTISFVVEKEFDDFNMAKDTDPAHNSAWGDFSKIDYQKNYPTSPGRYVADNEFSENTDSDDDNLAKVLARGGHGSIKSKKTGIGTLRKGRKSKTGNNHKNHEATPKSKASKRSGSSHSNSAHSKFLASIDNNDTSESSLGDFAEEARRLTLAENVAPPKSPNSRSLSKLNQSASSSRSIAFDFDNFEGDYLKVTVQKESESKAGIQLVKSEGKFLLTTVPQHEKRIAPGMQVLAINGVVNLNTVSKAEDLISRRNGDTVLVLDFSSPLVTNAKCPCCSRRMTTTGKHVQGAVGRMVARGRTDEASTAGSVEVSVAESEITTRAANKAPPGLRVARIPERPVKYQLDDFDSDSDDDEERKQISKRGSISHYQPNDKFMISVSKMGKNKDPGLSLFDHKGMIYISRIQRDGIFYSTPILEGDKVLSVNGKKVSVIKNALNALSIIEERDSVSLFVLRPDPNDKDYKEARQLFPP